MMDNWDEWFEKAEKETRGRNLSGNKRFQIACIMNLRVIVQKL